MPNKQAEEINYTELQSLTKEKEYVPESAGLKRGSQGSDVDRLQQYLTMFGYVETPVRSAFGLEATEVPPPKKGVFDAKTEDALKRFQEFNNLPPTGELDEPTLELMSKPRCGFPDLADFTLDGRKWPSTSLTFGYQNFTPDLTQAQIRAAIKQALDLWAAVTPLSFTEVPFASSPDIVIRFVAGNHGDGSNFDGVSGVLAHAFFPPPNGGSLAGDTHFDEAETWSVNLPASGIDLVTVAAHEFGHALGLAHSTVSGALMAPFYGGPHRNLESDDIAGIRAIYGSGGGWASLGGVITSNIAATRNADGRLEIFARGTDNALWHRWQTAPNNGWAAWASLGGVLTSDPVTAQNADGRLEVFVRGTDNAVWHRWQTAPSNGWSGWDSLGGVITSKIATARNADGRLEIFARGTDNALWHRWQTAPNNGWSGWASLGGVLTSDPIVVQNADGRLEIFVRGTDNAVWHRWQTIASGGWSGWASLGGAINGNIAAARNLDGRLEIFVRGTDNAVWHRWQTAAGNGWS